MRKHEWIAEVFLDIHSYALENGLTSVAAAIENVISELETDIGPCVQMNLLGSCGERFAHFAGLSLEGEGALEAER